MTPPTVGVVGLGLLGSAVAARLLGSGWSVRGYDLQADRARAPAGLGGTALNSASEVFAACEITFLVLPDSDVTAAVIEAATALSPDAVIIDLTTGDPDQMARFGSQLAARGIGYVDASIGGSSEQVRDGDAIVMAGGEKAVLDRQGDVLASFAREVFHVGPWGSGARMKLAAAVRSRAGAGMAHRRTRV
jgi:3-hydroxyisobutyrate dehydrogenase-like beta-hydroxyacid dehydrogenase